MGQVPRILVPRLGAKRSLRSLRALTGQRLVKAYAHGDAVKACVANREVQCSDLYRLASVTLQPSRKAQMHKAWDQQDACGSACRAAAPECRTAGGRMARAAAAASERTC